jgi:uncharacterized membrane protein YozB (DUF420 family)
MNFLPLLPPLNATLNATSGVLLCCGYYFIRHGQRRAHARCMVSAFVVSSLFLISYLVYHAFAGRTVFPPHPVWRPIYLTILLTHTILATVVAPLAITALVFALRGRFERHRRVARWLFPIWLYVSVTGVVIYWMLYHLIR